MKRCPVCGKIYGSELLRFCRFDGSRLTDISNCEAPTILLKPHEIPRQSTEFTGSVRQDLQDLHD
jgi:hypothetical protein